jgi:4'-phosphopantetheinyl transferase
VLKEAYTKALGLGLQRRFDSFEVYDDPSGHPVLFDPTAGPQDGCWQLGLLAVPPGHLLGVAVGRGAGEPPLRLRVHDARRGLLGSDDPTQGGPTLHAVRLAGLSALVGG